MILLCPLIAVSHVLRVPQEFLPHRDALYLVPAVLYQVLFFYFMCTDAGL